MKVIFSVSLFCIVFVFSCKKPREGYYRATFTDGVYGSSNWFQCELERKKSNISISSPTYDTDPHVSIKGELTDNKDSVNGYINYYYDGMINSNSRNYIISGKSKRNEISGKYIIESLLQNGTSGNSNLSGNFTIKFDSRKKP